MKCIDIHSHLIFGVDDGSTSLKQSIKTLNEIKRIGLEEIVCTPHVRYGNTDKITLVKANYEILKKYAEKMGITLYLGNEILYSDRMLDLLKYNRLMTLNNSKYILVEFKRTEHRSISHIVTVLDELLEGGYKPILAHPELYLSYQKIEYMYRIKESGVMLQMDATSILRKNNTNKVRKFAKKLLDERLVDIVASDSHCNKKRNYTVFKKAYNKIKRKYGSNYTDIIFYQNPLNVTGGNKDEKEK